MREEGAYWAYVTDGQPSQAGCIAAGMQRGHSPLTAWEEAGLVDEHVEVLDPSDEPGRMPAAINRPRTS